MPAGATLSEKDLSAEPGFETTLTIDQHGADDASAHARYDQRQVRVFHQHAQVGRPGAIVGDVQQSVGLAQHRPKVSGTRILDPL